MRIIITGGRTYTDTTTIRQTLAADLLGWRVERHPAQWDRHGRAAGPIRNQHMADLGADLVLAFPGGRGTAHMVRCAQRAGIPVRRIFPGGGG